LQNYAQKGRFIKIRRKQLCFLISIEYILKSISAILSKQTFHYTRCITPKRVTGLRCPIAHLRNIQSQGNTVTCEYNWWSGDETFAKLCKIWPSWNSNTRLSAPERGALTMPPSRRKDIK